MCYHFLIRLVNGFLDHLKPFMNDYDLVNIGKYKGVDNKGVMELFNKKRLQGRCLTLKPLDNSYLT